MIKKMEAITKNHCRNGTLLCPYFIAGDNSYYDKCLFDDVRIESSYNPLRTGRCRSRGLEVWVEYRA